MVKFFHIGVPVVVQWLTNLTRNHEVSGSIPGRVQLRIWQCRELWCRWQTWLRSDLTFFSLLLIHKIALGETRFF